MSQSGNLTEQQTATRQAIGQGAATLATAFSSFTASSMNRRVARFNREVSEMQAKDAITRGREAEERLRRGVRQTIGEQRAGFAAQNVQVDDVDASAVDIQADTAMLGELDALMIRNNARREAFGIRMRGAAGQMQAGATSATQTQQGWATLLSGAGTTYSTYRGLTG